ncbi:HAMP domain-containing sensor histidine kinase [Actinoplanes sp. NPDC023936]|uniref:sensor histidine kinase n=1 Tax=Actinoplanes sp. NPDC023936 TaxID=3154910 RepID=UPI0033BFF249
MFGLRRGTVSARFTILYASVFLGSGATLLALAFLLSGSQVTSVAPVGAGPAATVQQDRQLMTSSATALFMMALVSLVMGRVLAGRVLRPLRSITSATQRITAESLDRRLAVAGPADEVKALADTIDDLLGRLEASFGAQRRFVANASHELRTPLATMRAALDVAVAKPNPAPSTVALAARLRGQLDRVDHLLDGFLVLTRAQHGILADAETVDLGALITTALRQRAPEIDAKRLTVTAEVSPHAGNRVSDPVDGEDAITTRGSPALLARLVENVVDNAVRHNHDHGWITITAVPGPDEIVLTVETGGPPLDQRDVDRLAQPFERLRPAGAADTGPGLPGTERVVAERAGSSSGLGLSIVAAVATAHGGRLHLAARSGGGLRVTVTLAAVS